MKVIPPLVPLPFFSCSPLPIYCGAFFALLLATAPLRGQVCNDLSLVTLDADCSVPVTPDMVLESIPNDTNYIVALTTLTGVPIGNVLSAVHLGDTVRATVTDTLSGNSCSGLLAVADFLPPVLACSDLVLPCALPDLSPLFLSTDLQLAAAYPVVSENCGPYNLNFSDTRLNLDCTDPQDRSALVLRIWTATDASGNTASCAQRLTLQRVHAADVLFPADTSVACTDPKTAPAFTGQPYIFAFGKIFPLLGSAAACELSIDFHDQTVPFCGGNYAVLRTWSVNDDCLPGGPDNPQRHTSTITVRDKTGPAFSCPKDTLVHTDPLGCSRTFDLPDLILHDACSGVSSLEARWTAGGQTYAQPGSLSDFPANNYWNPDTLGVLGFAADLPAGEIVLVTYTAADGCGNTSTCSFRVTVSDGIPPFPVCDEYTKVAIGGSGESRVFATTFDDGSVENCATMHFKARRAEPSACQSNDLFFDQVKFCCADVGKTVAVILRVYDVQPDTGAVGLDHHEKQAADCLVQVLVEDKLKPQCQPPAHTTVSCEGFDPSLKAHGTPHFLDNCCLDTTYELLPNYSLFDTLCNRGTITRTFRALDCNGLSAQCTQRLVVQYVQTYAIQFPDDVFVSDCDTLGVYSPAPIIYGQNCAMLGISYEDNVNTAGLLACYWIERTWRIINWCHYDPNLPFIEVPNPNPSEYPLDVQNIPGPMVAPKGYLPASTIRRISANDPMPTDYSTFWSAQANGYTYRQTIVVRDDQPPKFRGCPATGGPVELCDHTTNDPDYWNAPYWSNPHEPGSTDMCEGLANLAATANDACSKGNLTIRYMLYLDLDNNGVQETLINSISPPPAGMVRFGNAFTPNFSGGELRQFDQRPVPPGEKYRFTILVGGFSNITGFVRWVAESNPGQYIVPVLPHGDHRIRWIADDGCGNKAECEYPIRVRDCRSPELICLKGLSTDMPSEKNLTLSFHDFLWDVSDNCSPVSEIKIGVRKAGSGLGFPLLPDGTPAQSLRFDCSELGNQPVELWAMDHAGNMNTCQTYVQIQDQFSVCANTKAAVAGTLKTAKGDGLEVATMTLTVSGLQPASFLTETDQAGAFAFPNAVPPAPGSSFVLTPAKDDGHLNGVSTYDLSLINRHILGLEPFDIPYKLIAADVNKSRSVTTNDVLELRKAILGITQHFPGTPSWRFVDAGYVFPNPSNPFQEIFPETRTATGVQASRLNENFIAIKIGDVSGNALTSSLLATTDRATETALLDVAFADGSPATDVRAGQIFDLAIRATEPLSGYQFTLAHAGLEVLEILPGAGMRPEHFAVFPGEKLITVSWDGLGKPEFVVRFRAIRPGAFEEMLHLSSQITRSEAYRFSEKNNAAPAQALALRFGGTVSPVVKNQGFELYPNEPNPWHDRTRIRFYLPDASEATLTVYDAAGQQVFAQTRHFAAGYQSVVLDAAALPAAALYYRVDTPAGGAGGKMVRW
ncbi:MAG: hypothetical protein ABMA02_08255 [Saprospiraceae bacterium]